MPAPRISVEEMKKRLETEDITILDVRQDEPYAESSIKIKGSIRIDPNSDAAIQSFINLAVKNRPIITYCT